MAERLIGVIVRALDGAGRRRSWGGNAWLDLEDRTGRPVAMEVDRAFVRFLAGAHSVTIHLSPRGGNRDIRPVSTAPDPDPSS